MFTDGNGPLEIIAYLAKEIGQLEQLRVQLEANEIRRAVGSHGREKQPRPNHAEVPAADHTRAIALSRD